VLNMTVREGMLFFASVNRIASKLRVMDDVGLGYLRLGQSAYYAIGRRGAACEAAAFLSKRTSERRCTYSMSRRRGFTSMISTKLLAAFRQLN